MDQTDLEILRNFEQVWQRVQKEKTQQTENDDQALEALLDGLGSWWLSSRKLACLTCGTQKNCLMELSNRMKKQYDRLQLHYFLKKGDIYFCNSTWNFASYTPYNLRKLWLSIVENEKFLKKCMLNEGEEVMTMFEDMKKELSAQKIELELLIGTLLQ